MNSSHQDGALLERSDSSSESTERVLLHPQATDAYRGASYTRVIRLQHGPHADGRLLATCEYFQLRAFPIYESLDDGLSWSAQPISVVRESVHGEPWALKWQPHLYELPQTVADLPAGTVMLAGNALTEQENQFDLQLYVSLDRGRTWVFRSSIDTSPLGHGGIWEPNIQLLPSGELVAYYSDETRKSEGYNQFLGHRVSLDGGRSWGSMVLDVAVPDGHKRPGMAVVQPLPDGRYAMVYELVLSATEAPLHFKVSPDGLDWGDPTDLGQPVRSSEGAYLSGTPYMVWAAAGGPNGTLVVSSMHSRNGKSDGVFLMLNHQLGAGDWSEFRAPVQIRSGNDHAGWSQGLIATVDGLGVLQLGSSDVGNGLNEIRYARRQLPTP